MICDDGEGVAKDVAPICDEVGGDRLFHFVGNGDELCVLGECVCDDQYESFLVEVVEEWAIKVKVDSGVWSFFLWQWPDGHVVSQVGVSFLQCAGPTCW